MKNKRTFPLLMLIWVSFLLSANAFSQGTVQGDKPDLIVKMVAERIIIIPTQIESLNINHRDFRLTATVTNDGDVASKSTEVVFYHSSNEQVLRTDREVGRRTIPPLQPEESREYHIETVALASIGEHYYGAYVVPVKGESKTGNNWFRPVSIWVYGGPGLEPPPTDFISDIAFTQNATYFVLNGQFLKLMSEGGAGPFYGVCGITLGIIQGTEPDTPVQLGNDTDPRLDKPGYFMYPLQFQSLNAQKKILEDEESRIQRIKGNDWLGIVTGWAGTFLGGVIGGAIGSVVPGAGTAAGIAFGAKIIGGVSGYAVAVVWKAESLADLEDDRVNEILSSTANPTLLLHPRKESRTAPPEITQYLFLIPNQWVRLLPITIKQVHAFPGTKQRLTATHIIEWNLMETASAAPHSQSSSLADYLPFQRLSPEAQEHFLRQLGEHANSEAWQMPETTTLLPNYPNPFNPETWIPYQLAEPADVTLTIYDIQGRVVRDLDLGHQRAGMYHTRNRAAHWDGRNAQGESVASGVYFYTLTAGDFSATRKLLIRK